MRNRGFTLIEVLVVVGIVGVLATFGIVALQGANTKARDVKRINALAQIGRFLASGQCYVPDGGPGEYDLTDLVDEVKAKFPQYANFLSKAPQDPRIGTDTESGYKYIMSSVTSDCVIYANLENAEEEVTLTGISEPTPGGGTGILQATSNGPNGTNRYYQYANK